MPYFKDQRGFKRAKNMPDFNTPYQPGDKPQLSGIYRCQLCGFEVSVDYDDPMLPPTSTCGGHHRDWKLKRGVFQSSRPTWKLVAAPIPALRRD